MHRISMARRVLRRGGGAQLLVLRWCDLLFWLREAGRSPRWWVGLRTGSSPRRAPPRRESAVSRPSRCDPAIRERDRLGNPPTVHPAAPVAKAAVHGTATFAPTALRTTPVAHGAASSRR
jgi:hypothetical protein